MERKHCEEGFRLAATYSPPPLGGRAGISQTLTHAPLMVREGSLNRI
jgi:hypothetical protein